ncbi:nucleotidyltransferase family protein [Stutzerimonas nitrititolerans]|uniref:nucleotidyltransferase family protein n=1 Tax=Stutzerimonas nitrititolerans TaxID=2482751 RepID=UPI00289E05EC|nr:nucleotidyltransferase family protein [Stutzerimonas nitrititolerans]
MKRWHTVLLPPTATIREAMRMLDKGSQRIVLICDAEKKLLGTVTDGDTRRGLLADANMQDPVRSVMNPNPVSVTDKTSREQRLKLMKQHDLTAIPILDNNKRVLSLETLHQAMQPEPRDNPVFIMAGGFGTRLQPLTDHCPKPMLRVGDKPMLEHLIDQFISHGFHNFYISTHYLPEVIRRYFGDGSRWGVSIQYVHEDKPLGTGGALGLLPKNLPQLPLIMMNGDVLTKLDYTKLLKHHESQEFDATVSVREDEHRVPFGVIEVEDKLIVSMVEKPTYRYKINTGIYVLNPDVISSVQPGQRIDMPTLLEQRMAKNKPVGVYTSYDYWLDIGQMKDYQKAQSDIQTYFNSSSGIGNE